MQKPITLFVLCYIMYNSYYVNLIDKHSADLGQINK